MSGRIEVRFTCTEAEYADGVRAHLAERFRWRRDVPFAVAFVALSVAALALGANGVWIRVALGVALALAALLALGWFWVPVRWYRAQPKLRDEYRLAFDEEAIAFETNHVASALQWSTFQRAVVTARSVLLYYGPSAFTVLPRRALAASAAGEAGFLALLRRKIGRVEER